MRLSGWAREQGVTYQTAWRRVRDGRMPVPVRQVPSGTWTVDKAPAAAGRVVAYCRVSSGDQESDLDRQAVRVVEGANAQGLAVAEIVTEIDSGLDGKRRKLHRLLADPTGAVIVVERKDRLARFGVEHLQAALAATGRRLVVLDPKESANDLVEDMGDVLRSLCVRLYGQRAGRNRAARALAAATGEEASV
ncbi:IS607 family transposase [Micromonospora sp. NPDC006766]|uniref:IS607 family transposase n=1 Tax=Micromonospora sp. NPDC006766 TaxID=3154778 RepID=UPI0033D6DF2B